MSFVQPPSASSQPPSGKRQRKANYGDGEIRVMLEEVMLAAFNNKITVQAKTRAWDAVTAMVNACGVAKRSRQEIKEWKSMKAEVLGRQRRVGLTGGGPPEPPLPFEDTILQIISFESNLMKGVEAPFTASFVALVAVEEVVIQHGEVGCCHTLPVSLHTMRPDEGIHLTQYHELPVSHKVCTAIRPVCSSSPIQSTAPEAATSWDTTYQLPGDVSSVVVATGDDWPTAPSNEPSNERDPEPATEPVNVRPASGGRTRWRTSRARSKKTSKDFPAEGDKRAVFLRYLESTAETNKAKAALLEGRLEEQRVGKSMRCRREELRVASLEREGTELRLRAEAEILALRVRREALEVANLEVEREGRQASLRGEAELLALKIRRESLEVAKLEIELGSPTLHRL